VTNIDSPEHLQNAGTWDEAKNILARWLVSTSRALRGNLDFGSNVRAAGPYTLALTPGNDFVIQHSLGTTPIGRIVIGQSAAGTVLDGTAGRSPFTYAFRGSATLTATVWVI
jgi:hypothetical protein